jgi:type VI secretion system protein VasD
MNIIRILVACAPLSLAQCASAPKPPPPPVVTLVVGGTAEQNPDANGQAAPVAVRVLQLTATAKFERAEAFALIDREQQTLGADDAGAQEFVLSPSESRTVTIEPKPGVTAIGVAALYRNIDQAQWRADAPFAASGPTKLSATIGALTVTLKPAP